ncbi:SCO family protein [Streptomyces sp. ISL-86]|uniref:SCO family protein n=1 Tax=Streptomyces sp. ISL-86 TaxID=2819187 RepID=UPI001BEC6CD9|nr:SCO family protein [Streptomyces sp. ISL-86]MBT2454517.1 SCO family protein [Streptomyces sp. ISL-86]
MRKPALLATVITAAVALGLSACGQDSGTAAKSRNPFEVSAGDGAQHKTSTVLDTPFSKPELVLTDTHGKPFDLRKGTQGRPTLIYFGYTNCPDVCPLVMSNIGVAYKQLSKAQQEQLRVVFITSDPGRDTPEELGKWLPGAGNPDFIGLSGDFNTIQAAARSLGVGIEAPEKDQQGNVVSTHGKSVLAFSPKDDKAHVIYHEETTPDDYAKDLPKLAQGLNP